MAQPNQTSSTDWLQPPVEQQGLRRYIQTVRERGWVVLAITAIATLAAIAYVVTAEKVYEAQADILITPAPADQDVLVSLGLVRDSSDPTQLIETAARLITTPQVAARAATDLKDDPSVGGESGSALLGDVSATPVGQSNIVSITAQASSPEAAKTVANGMATAAIEERTVQLHDKIDVLLPRLQAQFKGSSLGQLAAQSLATDIAVLEGLRAGDDPTLQLETPATAPSSPSSPRVLLTIMAGLLGGLAIGIVVAFALRVLDPRLRREEQLRGLFRLPILARVPRERSADKEHPMKLADLSGESVEAYRTLRATLAARRVRGQSQVILVTGAGPSEGKTTSAVSLATSFALAGNRVILLEADLRRPSIGETVEMGTETGVVSVLIEQSTLENALVTAPTLGGQLRLLLADYSGPGVAELFSLPAGERLVAEARLSADVVIIDSPPLAQVVDTLPLARQADEVIVVTRLGASNLNRIKELGELLADNGVRPAGFVVIGAKPQSGKGYYYTDTSANGSGDSGQRRLLNRSPA